MRTFPRVAGELIRWFRKPTLPDQECEQLLAERDALLKILRETWVPPDGPMEARLRCGKIRREAAERLHAVDLKLRAGCQRYLGT
jgi:hypothetical protein